MSHRQFIFLLALLFLATTAPAQQLPPSQLPPIAPSNRPSIGISLEGGGALGLAHVGVIEWLEEHHIPVDRISGTSMGALVGAFYASGYSPAEMKQIATSDAFTHVFTLQTPYVDSNFRRRQDRREIAQPFTIGLKHTIAIRNAILVDRGVNEFLSRYFLAYNSDSLNYDQLPIPFRCVATDLNTLQPVTFSTGPIPQAVRASISIPGVFSPVRAANGDYLVDGGILNNQPVGILKNDLHADTIIAIHLQDAPFTAADTLSIVNVLNRAFDAGIENNVAQSEKLADFVLTIPVGSFSATDYSKASDLITAGYNAAQQNSASLLRYALNDHDWQIYLDARNSRRQPQPGKLLQTRVEIANFDNITLAEVHQVTHDLKPLIGHPISADLTIAALKSIQSNGTLSATWKTFVVNAANSPTPSTTNSTNPQEKTQTGIIVHLHQDPTGPPYLLAGANFAAATSNITRGEISLRFIDQNLGGFGSEFRANARIGYFTELNAEYYRLLTPSGFYLQPHAALLREPIYLWANQKRVAELLQQDLSAGLDFGRTFNNHMQLAAEWRAIDTHWSPRTGLATGPATYISGTAQTGELHFTLDGASSSTISPDGFRLTASVGALYHAVDSSNAPIFKLNFSRTRSWKDTNIFALSGELNSYLRSNVAQPYRFTLGGPLRLSASSFDEYRGTDMYLTRAGYLHRIAALPTGLGQGLYTVVAYEAGEMWSPESRAFLRQDFTGGLLANTPIGVITIGAAIGDAGHRKLFITLGRWF